jgi:group I intron endonuclease
MYIYKTTNIITGKIYIGKCGRKRSSKNYLGSGKYLKRAIKKYGKENFKKEIIEDNIEDYEILNYREIFYISLYDAMNSEIGYNLTKGGDGISNPSEAIIKLSKENRGPISGSANPFFGKHHTEEFKIFISKQNSGVKQSLETRKKVSESNQGIKINGSSSKYVGVYWNKICKKWCARIKYNCHTFYLGLHESEIEAGLIYNEAALELYGWKAKINQITEEDILDMWREYGEN